MTQPVLSIIIPTLNSGSTLYSCLESIINQTYKNIEILIIDGLSTDNTIDIARNYATKYNYIDIVSERDFGIYDAMNKGISLSKGEWLYFLGSDDTLSSINTLNRVLIPELHNNYDIIYGNVISSRFQGRYDYAFDQDKIFIKNICHQAIFFKKDVFTKIGIFNLKYKSHSDWDHNMKWILNPDIKNLFVNIDIAEYADGGFSSQTLDIVFERDKMFNYLKYGFRVIGFNKSKRIFNQLFKESLKQRDLKRIVQLGFLSIPILTQKLKNL